MNTSVQAELWVELVKHLKSKGYCITDLESDTDGVHRLRGVPVGKGSIINVLHNLKGDNYGMVDRNLSSNITGVRHSN